MDVPETADGTLGEPEPGWRVRRWGRTRRTSARRRVDAGRRVSGRGPNTGSRPSRTASAAATNPSNSGCGRSGRLLNSGWNWLATNHGWSWSSTISTSRPSGDWPDRSMPGRLERLAIPVVHLEAVAVPLVDDLLAVDRGGLRAGRQLGRVEAEAHRAALVLHVALVGHEVDDRVLGEHVELGRVGVRGADDLARELDDRALQAEAQAEVRDAVVAGVVGGEDLALDAAMAEAARDQDAGGAVEPLVDVLLGERLASRPSGSWRRPRAPRRRAGAPR